MNISSFIDEFARAAHKNLLVMIPNATIEQVAGVLDQLAETNHWEGRTISQTETAVVLRYKTTKTGWLVNSQELQFVLTPTAEGGISLTVQTSFVLFEENEALFQYFYRAEIVQAFFDFLLKNRFVIGVIKQGLLSSFPQATFSTRHHQHVATLGNAAYILLFLKLYYLFIITFIVGFVVFGIVFILLQSV